MPGRFDDVRSALLGARGTPAQAALPAAASAVALPVVAVPGPRFASPLPAARRPAQPPVTPPLPELLASARRAAGHTLGHRPLFERSVVTEPGAPWGLDGRTATLHVPNELARDLQRLAGRSNDLATAAPVLQRLLEVELAGFGPDRPGALGWVQSAYHWPGGPLIAEGTSELVARKALPDFLAALGFRDVGGVEQLCAELPLSPEAAAIERVMSGLATLGGRSYDSQLADAVTAGSGPLALTGSLVGAMASTGLGLLPLSDLAQAVGTVYGATVGPLVNGMTPDGRLPEAMGGFHGTLLGTTMLRGGVLSIDALRDRHLIIDDRVLLREAGLESVGTLAELVATQGSRMAQPWARVGAEFGAQLGAGPAPVGVAPATPHRQARQRTTAMLVA